MVKGTQFAGWIGRTLGSLFPIHKVAEQNLRLVMPDISDEERTSILSEMWDHWARMCVECFHFEALEKEDIEICGQDILE